MGSNVSFEGCKADYNITLNCSANPGQSWGDFRRGQFPPDPDIAGIGIVSVFVAVTSLALLVGFADIIWQLYKSFVKKKGMIWSFHANKPREERTNPSVSDILETIVISCSDQQLFTGGAYALTVRYFKGCSVSAYHYNVLVNGLLVTCATHLIAVTVVMNYWRYPLMASLRVVITVLIFLVTGLLLAKQQASTSFGSFPLAIPQLSDASTGSPLFLPAACFESDLGKTGLPKAVQNSIDHLNDILTGPNQAWTLYIAMLLWWVLAIVAELFRFLHRGWIKGGGRRQAIVHRVRSWTTGVQDDGAHKRKHVANMFRILFHFGFVFYLVAGLAISTTVVVLSAIYIQNLRSWVDKSGWLDTNNAGSNPENDVTTFGQLVPILMTALTVFAFMQMLSEKLADASRKKRMQEDVFNKSLEDPYHDDKAHGVTYSVTQVAPSPPRSDKGGGGGAWTITPASTWVAGGTAPTTPALGVVDPIAPAPPPKGHHSHSHTHTPSASRTSFSRPSLGHVGTGSSQATSSVRAFGDSREHVSHAR